MSKLMQDAILAITALKNVPPPPGTLPAEPLNPGTPIPNATSGK
jgi:hypothetical protein